MWFVLFCLISFVLFCFGFYLVWLGLFLALAVFGLTFCFVLVFLSLHHSLNIWCWIASDHQNGRSIWKGFKSIVDILKIYKLELPTALPQWPATAGDDKQLDPFGQSVILRLLASSRSSEWKNENLKEMSSCLRDQLSSSVISCTRGLTSCQ